MRLKLFRDSERSLFLPLAVAVGLAILATLPLPWNETLDNFSCDLCFKLRGPRPLAPDFVLVALDPQSIQALGGWPLTRDYYGYLVHYLSRQGAKVIGFDILLDQPHARYPEHDAMLSSMLAQSRRVCLPFLFNDFGDLAAAPARSHRQIFQGDQPVFPLADFRAQVAGLGFSNFERTPSPHNVPLVAAYRDSILLSFGAELARLRLGGNRRVELAPHTLVLFDSSQSRHEIPIDAQGRMRLNHFGDLQQLHALSFVALLQSSQKNPDSLDWRGKVVLVAVTDPAVATLKATPLAPALPASLLHLNVAENIVEQNFLRGGNGLMRGTLTLVLALFLFAFGLEMPFARAFLWGCAVLGLYAALTLTAFSFWNFLLPFFYPMLAGLVMLAGTARAQRYRRRHWEKAQREALQMQHAAKQAQLEEAESNLERLRKEVTQHATRTEKNQLLAEEQQIKILNLEKQLRDLQVYRTATPERATTEFAEIVCAADGPMAQVLALVQKVAKDDLPVLIYGETGTGKELVARAIHRASERQSRSFVAINCGALPEGLLESELFGHEKGSFTGAHALRRGRFELADGGTLFLDEITETVPALQARLLRVLQDGVFERVGGEHALKTDARIIAACNRDLQREVEQQRFRVDLYYRLNGFQIILPPLRERREDIPLLVRHFLRRHGYQQLEDLSHSAMAALQNYGWPGNVRELENVLRRAAVLAQSEKRTLVQLEDLPAAVRAETSATAEALVYRALPEQILEMLRALKFSRTAISQTAKALGNRDRGTITEYLRGICFEHFVQAQFSAPAAALNVAGTAESETVQRVRAKLEEYLTNLQSPALAGAVPEKLEARLKLAAKGLPRRYHPYLKEIMEYLARQAGAGEGNVREEGRPEGIQPLPRD